MLKKRCQVAVEIEASEGTAETLEAADVFLAFNPSFTPTIDITKRDPVRGSLSAYPSVPGARSAKMSFEVELVGASTAGQSVHYADALRSCGVDETLVASTSATYAPASDSVPSVTMAMYVDGVIYKLWGARGDVTLTMDAGKPGVFKFEFTGADFSKADGALLSGTSLDTTIPPVFMDASLTIDSYSAILSKLEIKQGNTVSLRKDANSISGHLAAVITNREATLSLDPEDVLVATEDFLGAWRSGSRLGLTTTIGSDTGNTVEITAPKVQYDSVSLSERDGQQALDISALLTADAGDDEWQIQIT